MDIKPLQGILIAVLFLVIGGGAAYLSTRAATIHGPSDLSKDHDNSLYVRIHQKVFVYNREGEYQSYFDLAALGIKEIWGGLAFFRNGDLLVSPSLLFGDSSGAGAPVLDRLNRCELSTGQCRLLSRYGNSFRRTFRTFIDRNEHIFLSDSSSGKVFWLNSDGSEVDELSSVLSHPNKILRHDDRVIIADTEANTLVLVPLKHSQFASEDQWTRISTEPLRVNSWRVSQPVDFSRVENGWSVLVKDKAMSGSVLRHYADDGSLTGETNLQRRGFIVALETLAGNLVVTDYLNMRVLRFAPDGSALSDLTSPEQQQYVEELQNQIDFFETSSVLAWTVFGVLLIAGMVFGLRRELQRANGKKAVPGGASAGAVNRSETAQPNWGDPRVKWLGRPRIDLFVVILGLIVLMLISLGFIETGAQANSSCSGFDLIWKMMAVMILLIAVPLVIARQRFKNTHIGVRDEWVVVRFPDGTTEMARDRDLLDLNNGFVINRRKVAIGNQQLSMYNKADVEALLKPRLALAKTLSPGEHMRWEWQNNKRATFFVGSLSVIMLIAVLILESGYGDTWLKENLRNSAGPTCSAESTSLSD